MNKVLSLLVVALLCATSAKADKGNFMIKIRGGYLNSSSGIETGSKGTLKGSQDIGPGAIGELAGNYFFTDNFAVEISAAFAGIKYTQAANTNKFINKLPLSALAQFHLPIYNKFYPYLGIGYSYGFIFNEPNGVSIKNNGNVVFQGGVDIFLDMDRSVALNVDAKFIPKTNHDITIDTETFRNKVSSFAIMGGIGVLF